MKRHIFGAGSKGLERGGTSRLGLRAASVLAVSAMAGAGLSVAGPMSSGAAFATTSGCTYNGVPAPGPVTGVTPGETINIVCTNLPSTFDGQFVGAAEASPLGGFVSNGSNEADTTNPGFNMVSSTGSLSLSYTIPTTFSASDPNAACPPTQAQINAGLVECVVGVGEASGSHTEVTAGYVLYKGQGTPAAPSLAVSPGSVAPGGTVSVSDGTSPSGYFWGNAAAVTTIPASDITVGGVTASSSSLSVSKASYDPTTGVITPPSISGSFTVAKTAAPGSDTVDVAEPSSVPGFSGPVSGSAPLTVSGGTSPLPVGAVGGLLLAVAVGGGVVFVERKRRRNAVTA